MANSDSCKGFLCEWKIKNPFSVIRRDSEEFIFQEHRWKLTLVATSIYLNIFLCKKDSKELTRGYRIQCCIKDKYENSVRVTGKDFYDMNFAKKEVWWILKKDFRAQIGEYLINGSMIFYIFFSDINVTKMEIQEKIREKDSDQFSTSSCSLDTVACLENLSHNFELLMADRTQSDVTLNCEGHLFPVHKNILSARSPVFSAMFQSDMAESRTGNIEITDMDASILHQFLLYVYFGKLSDLSVDTVPKLYAAADKYAIKSLKKLCAKFMKENLARENACKFLITADVYGDRELKDCAINFITNIELFIDEHAWFAFHDEHPKLASEVIHHAYKTNCLSKKNRQCLVNIHC